jgi:hypothetical protein
MHLIGIHLMGVHLMSLQLVGLHVMSVYLIDVYLSGHASHRHTSHRLHLIGVHPNRPAELKLVEKVTKGGKKFKRHQMFNNGHCGASEI